MANLSSAEDLIREHLEKIGATLRKDHYTGDSSHPTEYTIQYKSILVVQPTLDLALVTLIKQLADRA